MEKQLLLLAMAGMLLSCKKQSTEPVVQSTTPVKTTSPLNTACIFEMVPRAVGGYGYRVAECHPGMSANEMGIYLSEHVQFISGQMAHNCRECDSIVYTLR